MINAILYACKVRSLPMRFIRSASNPRVQSVKKILKTRKNPLFVVEGKKLFLEAVSANIHFEEIFVTPEVWAMEKEWLAPLEQKGVLIQTIAPSLLKNISDVETPQGIVGVARRTQPPESIQIARSALLLISIRDPGNLGAIMRSAESFGCSWIGYTSDCADPFQPKAVRASMGSAFRVPLIEISDPVSFLQQTKIPAYGLTARGRISIEDWKPSFPVILCIGSESHGLPAELPLKETIFIPMKGRVESLNAAVAASICLYDLSTR